MVSRRPCVVWACADPALYEDAAQGLAGDFDVITVRDGVAALQAIREHLPDLVVADVVLPRMNGPRLAHVLRADPQLRSLPLIYVVDSASADRGEPSDGYLFSPFTAAEVRATVERAIELGQTERASAIEEARARHEMARTDQGEATPPALDLPVLSQIERHALQREALDLSAIAYGVVAELRRGDPSRVVDVRVGDGLRAVADRELVGILLGHLLGNAWKFTRPRARAEIVVGLDRDGVFVIRDNGVGFDQRHVGRLFEPFGRLHSATDFAGDGIGLAIVRRIVERHGGDVWAHGRVDRGATVWFTLGPGSIPGLDE